MSEAARGSNDKIPGGISHDAIAVAIKIHRKTLTDGERNNSYSAVGVPSYSLPTTFTPLSRVILYASLKNGRTDTDCVVAE